MAKELKDTAIYTAFDGYTPLDTARPEKSLLLAILMSAMSDLRKNGSAQRQATEYLLDPDESYVFSFVSVCNHLDIDPRRILRSLGLEKRALAREESSRNHRTNGTRPDGSFYTA